MSTRANVFLLDPATRSIRPHPTAPSTRELLLACVYEVAIASARLHLHSLGLDVPVVDDAGRQSRTQMVDGKPETVAMTAPLTLVTGWQPARPGSEAGHYTVRGLPFTGRAVLAAQVPGAGSIEHRLGAPTQLLRLAATAAEVASWIKWEPMAPAAGATALPYDVAMLETAAKLVAELAGDRGVVRFELRDLKANPCGAMNFQGSDWRGIRRYALDAFDRNTTPVFDWSLRKWPLGGVGDHSESPIAAPLVSWGERKAGAVCALSMPGRAPLYGRAASESIRGKAEWLPFPGVPCWQPSGESPMVTFAKLA